ncbi:hypothetical protein CEXT_469311 [Caerostris extrusa]|uniref:Uncharacterized protein n=1 Tax=Caerostris extrusa TaxID=172846 RepID=A0AAV4NED4_CAEEX|nr:hypothetical protein CEXT_469311 [Caerostris extrusa]
MIKDFITILINIYQHARLPYLKTHETFTPMTSIVCQTLTSLVLENDFFPSPFQYTNFTSLHPSRNHPSRHFIRTLIYPEKRKITGQPFIEATSSLRSIYGPIFYGRLTPPTESEDFLQPPSCLPHIIHSRTRHPKGVFMMLDLRS